MAQTKIKAGLFEGIIGNGTDGYFLMSNGDGTMTWSSVVINPTITDVDYPGTATAADPAGGETITLTGTGFKTGATVTVGGTSAPAVSYVSATQITFTTPAKAAGDYDIVVTNTDTGSATFINGISFNGIPAWTTAAGSLGTFASGATISTITLQATEPDAGTITFNITNGALPTGLSLTGANIDGTTSILNADTLYTFTVTATDDENQATPRTFTITVQKQFVSSENFTINTYTGNGSTQSIEGKIGTAALFNGSSSHIDLGTTDFVQNNNTLSISAWCYFEDLSTSNAIVTKWNNSGIEESWGFWHYGAGSTTLHFAHRDAANNVTSSYSNSSAISENTWHHCVLVWDGATVTYYVDGTQVGTSTNSDFNSATKTSSANIIIGAQNEGSAAQMTGKIDQVRLFNKALSSSEVTTLYGESNTSTTKSTTDIFDDGSGVALYEFEKGAIDTGGVSGKFGSAAIFNGSSSRIQLPDNAFTNQTSYTVSSWVKPNSVSSAQNIFSTWGYQNGAAEKGYMIRINVSAEVQVNHWDSSNNSYTSTGTINANTYTHIAVTATQSELKIYINGSLDSTHSSAAFSFNTSSPITTPQIGAYRSADGNYAGNYFDGFIDDLRVYSDVLTSTEVGYLYNNTTASIPTDNLVAYYKLDGDARDEQQLYDGTATNVTYAYDGTPTNVSFVGTSFQPDLVWIKDRDVNYQHQLYDTVRGATEKLHINTSADSTDSTGLTSFNSNGFTISTNGGINTNGNDYAAWCFKGGGTAVSNTDGSITSSVSANQDAGFSIVNFTSPFNGQTAGHGLSTTPEMIIVKAANTTSNWYVWTKDLTSGNSLALNLTRAQNTDLAFTVNSTTFTTNWTNTTYEWIAYCFHSVDGYQKIGSYTGTGSAGNSVATGFRPRFVMVKKSSGTGNWVIKDSQRDSTNPNSANLYPNLNNAENTVTTLDMDFDDNGFTLDGTSGDVNGSSQTYIYLAIA